MKSASAFKVLLVLALGCISNLAQVNPEKASTVLIDPAKPPVYIEFVRTGKCRKGASNFNFGDLCSSKSEFVKTFEAVWLRLVNNSRWSVGVTVDKAATEVNASSVVIDSTTHTNEKGEKVAYGTMLANNGAEMDVVYKSEEETGCDFHKRAPKGQSCFQIQVRAPTIPLPSISSSMFVPPGQSVIFPMERSHVIKYVNLYVLYNFSWEYNEQHFSPFPHFDSQHRAYFGWFDLEKGMKLEQEKKNRPLNAAK